MKPRLVPTPRMREAIRLQKRGASRLEVLAMVNGTTPLPDKQARATPVQHEAHQQDAGVKLLRAIGAKVYVRGHRRARPNPACQVCLRNMSTRQTPGIPDVSGFLPLPGCRRYFEWEVKAEGGKLSPYQIEYGQLCQEAGVLYFVGTVDELIAGLIREGFLRREQIVEARLP